MPFHAGVHKVVRIRANMTSMSKYNHVRKVKQQVILTAENANSLVEGDVTHYHFTYKETYRAKTSATSSKNSPGFRRNTYENIMYWDD